MRRRKELEVEHLWLRVLEVVIRCSIAQARVLQLPTGGSAIIGSCWGLRRRHGRRRHRVIVVAAIVVVVVVVVVVDLLSEP